MPQVRVASREHAEARFAKLCSPRVKLLLGDVGCILAASQFPSPSEMPAFHLSISFSLFGE